LFVVVGHVEEVRQVLRRHPVLTGGVGGAAAELLRGSGPSRRFART